MDVKTYYRHARSIGPFPARDCLRMARDCAEMDKRAKTEQPRIVSYEVLPDGSGMIRLSNSVKVF